MAAYTADVGRSVFSAYSSAVNGRMALNKVVFSRDVLLSSVAYFANGGGATIAARVYDTAGTLLASGSAGAVAPGVGAYGTAPALAAPLPLRANVAYYVGLWIAINYSGVDYHAGATSPYSYTSTAPTVGLTWYASRSDTTETFPGSDDTTVEYAHRYTFDLVYPRRGYNAPEIGRGRRAVFTP